MQLRNSLLAALSVSALLAAAGGGPALAQAVHEGKLTGTITSVDRAALPGVTVEVTSPALLGRRSTISSERGTYVFLNLPPGKYRVVASLSGFKNVAQDGIDVSPAAVVSLDLVMPVGGVEETVTVTAEGPIVDTKTSTIDSRLDSQLLAKLPTTRDAFYDLALSTPGMFAGSGAPAASTEFQSPTAYGSATNENVFLINGVDATSPRSGAFGALVNVNYDAVEEVRIVALGSRAEYGSYSGAAIDVLTKSGSNEFHGSAAFYSKLGDAASNQPAAGDDLGRDFLYVGEGEQLSGETKTDWEIAATIGGPIMKDKLWFFAALNYDSGAELPPRWSLERESKNRFVDAKLSAAPFANHRAFVSYHYENNDFTGGSWGSEPAWDTSMNYGVATKNHTVSGQWQYFPSGTTTLTAKYLGFWTDDQPTLPADRPANPGYVNWWKWADYGVNGAFPYIEGQQSNRQTLQADVSHFAEGFLGEHDVKFGVQYTKGRGNWEGGYFQNYINYLYPYRWTQSVENMQSWYGDTGLLFYIQRDTINPFLTVRTADSLGLFLDDQWTPNERLTINLGLRFDHMTTKYGEGKVFAPLETPDSLADPTLERTRQGTGNLFDFNTIAPRLGITYKLTEDGKTVARASWGRYYMPLSVEFLRRFGPDMPSKTRVIELVEAGPWSVVDQNGDGFIDAIETRDAARLVRGQTPISISDPQLIDPSWTLNVADDLKNQHTDQLTLNLERELFPNFSVGATYIFKRTGDLFANIPINRATGQEWQYERIPFTTSGGQQVSLYSIVEQDYNGDGVVDSGDIAWIEQNSTHRVQNMPAFDGVDPKRDYHGFQLVFHKRYSNRWQGLASVLYSKSDGISRRSFRQDFNVEGPMFYDDNWLGNLNYVANNLEGPLPYTPEWEFKLNGSYTIPGVEMDLGARLRLATGKPAWLIESYPQHNQWSDPEGGVIIPAGLPQIVAVDPNQPDYLPTLALLDLHLEKAFKLGGDKRRLNLVVDGFNIFNSNTPTDMDVQFEYGKVTQIPTSRRFRGGIRFEF